MSRLPSPLPRSFYDRGAGEVARGLLNKVLVRVDLLPGTGPDGGSGEPAPRRRLRAGRIVEVEAYAGEDDPGSHAYRGLTARTATMFGPPGRLYVYFTYGMHWCANAVCGPEGVAAAVLIRALAPLEGIEHMASARPAARRERDLCSGPAKLCQALGIVGDDDGADLVTASRGIAVHDDGVPPPARPLRTTRIGLRHGADLPWRWAVAGDPNVSGGARMRG